MSNNLNGCICPEDDKTYHLDNCPWFKPADQKKTLKEIQERHDELPRYRNGEATDRYPHTDLCQADKDRGELLKMVDDLQERLRPENDDSVPYEKYVYLQKQLEAVRLEVEHLQHEQAIGEDFKIQRDVAVRNVETVRKQLALYFKYTNHGAGCSCPLHIAKAAIEEDKK